MKAYTKYAIIVSGGTGSRMDSALPKQFLELKGLPVLMHSMAAFSKREDIKIVLVLNKEHEHIWKALCLKHRFYTAHTIVYGGENRFQSVNNGLEFIKSIEPDLSKILIAVHDGVRPLVDQNTITNGFDAAAVYGSAVPTVKSKDSVRVMDESGKSKALNRDFVLLVQTPQIFKADILATGYHQDYKDSFTDDASVIEKSGYPIHLVEGNIRNIKITYPIDLKIAEMWIV